VGPVDGLCQPLLLLPLGLGLWRGFLENQRLCPPIRFGSGLTAMKRAKRELTKAHIKYEALDNGFRSCQDPAALQKICDLLGAGAVKNFFWR
jgi:hypothetical protein